MLIDTHAHLNFREYKNEIPEIIKRAYDKNVKAIINVGSNYETSKKAVEIVQQYNANLQICANDANIDKKTILQHSAEYKNVCKMYAAVGCHPIHLSSDITETATFEGKEYKFRTKNEEFEVEKYQKLIDENRGVIVGIGEIGLDYYRLNDKVQMSNVKSNPNDKIFNEKKIQKQVFREHIKLAQKNNLPLILHCRGPEKEPYLAYDEMLEILNNANIRINANAANKDNNVIPYRKRSVSGTESKNEIPDQVRNDTFERGVIHCFGGNLEQARKFIKLGFYIGVNGIVTFKNSKELQDIVKIIPLERILLETDCPYLAPDPHRGKRNEPMYIPLIAQKIAELKNIDISEVEKQTTKNARKLFKI